MYNFLVSQTMRPMADSLPKIHNLWVQNRLSKTKSPTLNTHEAFLCLAQRILVTRAQQHSWVLSVNVFDKSLNKWLSWQSQHFRKPLIIFPHLTRAKHCQITPINSRFLHINRGMETFPDSHNLFKIPDVNQRLKRRALAFKNFLTKSLARSDISINFHLAE